MNTLFKNNYRRKRRMSDINIHKAMLIHANIYPMNKNLFVAVQPKNSRKAEFIDHLWLPFLDQPQSDMVVFLMLTF